MVIKKTSHFLKIILGFQCKFQKIVYISPFLGFQKGRWNSEKKSVTRFEKVVFFQHLLNFFQKSSLVRAKQLQIFGKFMFFRFFFFIKLDPCSRRESNRFFHTILAPIVSVKQEKISLKLIKI